MKHQQAVCDAPGAADTVGVRLPLRSLPASEGSVNTASAERTALVQFEPRRVCNRAVKVVARRVVCAPTPLPDAGAASNPCDAPERRRTIDGCAGGHVV